MREAMWLLLATIMIMPFETSPHLYIGESFLGLIPDVTVIKVLGLVGAAWALTRIAVGGGGEPVFRSAQARLFVALVLGVLISALLNGSAPIVLVKYLALMTFMPFILVSVQTRADLRRVIQALVLSMAVAVPYALWQQTRFSGRLGVGLYDSNYLAANLILIAPLAFALAAGETATVKRLAWSGIGFLMILGVLKTSSRGGYIGLLIAGLIYAYRRLGAAGAVGILMVLVLAALPMEVGQRALATVMSDGPPSPGVEESTRAHKALLWGGIRMVADAPLFGVGPQQFREYSRIYSGLERSYVAHNTYLELAAEAGLPVLIVFLFLLMAAVTCLRRAARQAHGKDDELGLWADGLWIGIVGFAVAGFFISAQYEKPFWLAIFLSIAVGRIAERLRAAPAFASAAALEKPPQQPGRLVRADTA